MTIRPLSEFEKVAMRDAIANGVEAERWRTQYDNLRAEYDAAIKVSDQRYDALSIAIAKIAGLEARIASMEAYAAERNEMTYERNARQEQSKARAGA